ncbi:hypothetical protein NPIL_236731, partial [Nephila pilipes]
GIAFVHYLCCGVRKNQFSIAALSQSKRGTNPQKGNLERAWGM